MRALLLLIDAESCVGREDLPGDEFERLFLLSGPLRSFLHVKELRLSSSRRPSLSTDRVCGSGGLRECC